MVGGELVWSAPWGACPPNLAFQGPAALPFLPGIGSRRENWLLAFLLPLQQEGLWERVLVESRVLPDF